MDKRTFIKVRLIGSYWKIAWALNFAEHILRLKIVYYAGGTGDGSGY
jgi:hypothetical protein